MTKLELAIKTSQYSPIFKGVNQVYLETVLSKKAKISSYLPGAYIASSGDDCKGLYILTEGSVIGEMIDEMGKTVQIEEVKTPKPIAISFIFGEGKFPVYVRANTNVSLMLIETVNLMKMFQENERILRNYLDLLSDRSQFLTRRISFLTSNSIKKKLAKYILDSLKKDSLDFSFPNSQERMAEFFGVTRPAFARVLKKFKDENLLDYKGRNISVLDLEGLKKIISEV